MIKLEKYHEAKFVLPCVVDSIDYERQLVLDVVQHKDQMFKKGEQLSYNGIGVTIEKKLKDYPIQTDSNIIDRLSFRKVRYFCIKNQNNE